MRKAKYAKMITVMKMDVELSGTLRRTILIGTPPIELMKNQELEI